MTTPIITFDPSRPLSNPRWWPSFWGLLNTGTATQAGIVARVFLTAFWIPRTIIVSRITMEITTFGGAGTKFRLGLYRDNGGTPQGGGLLADSGDIAADNTGVLINTFTLPAPIALPSGFIWGALETQDTVIIFRRYSGQPVFNDIGSERLVGCHYDRGGGYGALTDPCPTVTGSNTDNFCSRIRLDSLL